MKNIDGTMVIFNEIDGITVISNFVRPLLYCKCKMTLAILYHTNLCVCVSACVCPFVRRFVQKSIALQLVDFALPKMMGSKKR